MEEVKVEEEGTQLKITIPDGIALVVIVKHPDDEARVMPMDVEAPRELLEEFQSIWSDVGAKVRAELVRGLV